MFKSSYRCTRGLYSNLQRERKKHIRPFSSNSSLWPFAFINLTILRLLCKEIYSCTQLGKARGWVVDHVTGVWAHLHKYFILSFLH